MMRTMLPSVLLLVASLVSPNINAADFQVSQKDKAFTVRTISIKVGDTITFRNDDPFPHNIFSLSDAKTFDLGSYGEGASKTVTFDKPGSVDVECAIHPKMKLTVEVTK